MNKRHWSAASGLAVGALVVTGLSLPMQAQAAPGSGAPTSSDPAAPPRPDDLPNTLADAAAASARTPSPSWCAARPRRPTINGNRVIEVKSTGKDAKGKAMSRSTSTTPCEREEDIFTVLVDFGDKVDPDHRRLRRPAAQLDPEAGPQLGRQRDRRQLDLLGRELRPRALPRPDVRQRGVVQGLLRQAEQRPLPRQGRRLRLGHRCPSTSRATAQRVRRTARPTGPSSRTPATPGTTTRRPGKSDAEIKTYLAQFDKVDRYDFDERRRLQRARRLHRPLPGDPRR